MRTTITRRNVLSAGLSSGLLPALAARAATAPDRKRACVVLWMAGGPSQTDTFDPKPGHANGGPFKTLKTPEGVPVGEHLPLVAKHMKRLAVLRSMSTKEGDHGRASLHLRTGNLPQGAIDFPVFGALVAKEGERPQADLPGYVSITPRAVRLMRESAAKSFDLTDEDAKLRDWYGRNRFGQGCLLARRLVERGVPFVEVTLGVWDTHDNNFEQVRNLCGTLDGAWATLMTDLADRGLLDTTTVGRTPGINPRNGRDHYPAAWSVVLGGGGIKGGRAVGQTGAFPRRTASRSAAERWGTCSARSRSAPRRGRSRWRAGAPRRPAVVPGDGPERRRVRVGGRIRRPAGCVLQVRHGRRRANQPGRSRGRPRAIRQDDRGGATRRPGGERHPTLESAESGDEREV